MKRMIRIFTILWAFSCLILSGCQGDRAPWTELVTENGMDDFQQMGGKAIYEIEDGVIIGTTVPHTGNSFLCTRREYDNFILEYRVLLDTALNSGVQIRSHAYQTGRVHGYQVELDPSPRAWSGGVYDEARRYWLNDLTENEAGRKAFKNGKWNHFRIEAIGNSIKTWVNGTMCANMIDDADPSGFIAFQVHGVNVEREPWTEGVSVRWKDIRILTSELDEYKTQGPDAVPPVVIRLTNGLTEAEKEQGWELLFDGQSTEKWKGATTESFPNEVWKVENGLLTFSPSEDSEDSEDVHRDDIITIEEFSDFELKVDFMLTPGANSGIKYFVTEQLEGKAAGLEYQLIDDEHHPDAVRGEGTRAMAAVYDILPPGNRRIREPGVWNVARIVSRGQTVEHWLNNGKVLEYERGSEAFREAVARSKFKDLDRFGEASQGPILLQDHGDKVFFRNIKIRKLDQ